MQECKTWNKYSSSVFLPCYNLHLAISIIGAYILLCNYSQSLTRKWYISPHHHISCSHTFTCPFHYYLLSHYFSQMLEDGFCRFGGNCHYAHSEDERHSPSVEDLLKDDRLLLPCPISKNQYDTLLHASLVPLLISINMFLFLRCIVVATGKW